MGEKDKVSMDQVQGKTPEFRVSYPNVFEPRKQMNSDEYKFELDMLFPKTLDMTWLKKLCHAAQVKKWGPDKEKWPKKRRMPLRDGDEKADAEGYKGHWYITAKSDKKPQIVDQKVQPITDPDEFYGGCFAIAYIRAWAYNTNGNAGVSITLIHAQKTRKGERFGGEVKAVHEVFEELEFEDDEDETSGGASPGGDEAEESDLW